MAEIDAIIMFMNIINLYGADCYVNNFDDDDDVNED